MSTTNATLFMHDVPLGEPVDLGALRDHLESEITRGVLQLIRDRAAEADRAGRVRKDPATDPLEHRAYWDGAGQELENLFWEILKPLTHQKAAGQD